MKILIEEKCHLKKCQQKWILKSANFKQKVSLQAWKSVWKSVWKKWKWPEKSVAWNYCGGGGGAGAAAGGAFLMPLLFVTSSQRSAWWWIKFI